MTAQAWCGEMIGVANARDCPCAFPAGSSARQPFRLGSLTASGTGKIVCIAGQLARDTDGRCVGIDHMRAQMEQTFQNLGRCSMSAGATWAVVVKPTLMLPISTSSRKALMCACSTSEDIPGCEFPLPRSVMAEGNHRHAFAAAPVHTSRYSATICAASGTRGLLPGLPDASACSAISAILLFQSASLIP